MCACTMTRMPAKAGPFPRVSSDYATHSFLGQAAGGGGASATMLTVTPG